MPIEIKELHIKINVDEKAAAATTAPSVDEAQIMRAINESVEQVVNIEQRKKER
jgi:lauroyl/myristoyl acyltransferase